MSPRVFLALLVAATALAGCAPRQLYAWGSYDQALYAHYKNPGEHERHLARLQEIIQKAEGTGARVPPGVYAQYGYALYEAGRPEEAVLYFGKEKANWPESTVLMDKLVRNIGRQTSSGSKAAGGT